jgi:hypothetical protein
VAGTKEILAQRIIHVTAALVHEGGQEKISAILNCGDSDENDPAKQLGFACHSPPFGKSDA